MGETYCFHEGGLHSSEVIGLEYARPEGDAHEERQRHDRVDLWATAGGRSPCRHPLLGVGVVLAIAAEEVELVIAVDGVGVMEKDLVYKCPTFEVEREVSDQVCYHHLAEDYARGFAVGHVNAIDDGVFPTLHFARACAAAGHKRLEV